jgi:hypothetical protein
VHASTCTLQVGRFLRPSRILITQVPISTVLLVVVAIAFLIRGSSELDRFLDWIDNRQMMLLYEDEILRAESSGRFEVARRLKIVATQYAQREERDRPSIGDVLFLICCFIGPFVACSAAGWCWGHFLVAAILRRAGHGAVTSKRKSGNEKPEAASCDT